jgi:hypothetical protein
MMQAVETSETSVNLHQSAQNYNPEESHLHSHRHENLKSYLNLFGSGWGPGSCEKGNEPQLKKGLEISWLYK